MVGFSSYKRNKKFFLNGQKVKSPQICLKIDFYLFYYLLWEYYNLFNVRNCNSL